MVDGRPHPSQWDRGGGQRQKSVWTRLHYVCKTCPGMDTTVIYRVHSHF